jgi:aconitate hydratase
MPDAATRLATPLGERTIHRLDALGDLSAMPYSIKVLAESVLRNQDGRVFTDDDVAALAAYDATAVG